MDKQLVERHGKVYEAGTVLFREGEVGKRVYVINEGRIRISKRVNKTEALIEVLGPGEFCGELALVLEAPHPVTATVIEPARLLIVDAKQFEAMVRSNGEIALRMLRKLAGRLTEAQFRLVNFQLRRPMGRLLHQLKWEVSIAEDENAPLVPEDLAEVLGLQRTEVESLLAKLVAEGLIVMTDGRFMVPDRGAFDRYLTYLELKDRYEFLED
ncbi:MAG: Crp/Fnr family transcriptional regulator [Myxococcota bacterium]|jgi:CRP-like cAMP-binding protein|nr:Crp/Fnr family transcriptional regulator [Myxococcota bacterium]